MPLFDQVHEQLFYLAEQLKLILDFVLELGSLAEERYLCVELFYLIGRDTLVSEVLLKGRDLGRNFSCFGIVRLFVQSLVGLAC